MGPTCTKGPLAKGTSGQGFSKGAPPPAGIISTTWKHVRNTSSRARTPLHQTRGLGEGPVVTRRGLLLAPKSRWYPSLWVQ